MGATKLMTAAGGGITLDAASTASDKTITVPARTGNMAVDGPAFSAYGSGNPQSISSNTWTKVQLNTKDFDTNSNFDATTNYRFFPTVAGYYQINGVVLIAGSSFFAIGKCAIYKNGSMYRAAEVNLSAAYNNWAAVNASCTVYLNGTTDYIELYGYTDAATAGFYNRLGTEGLCSLSGAMVRAA